MIGDVTAIYIAENGKVPAVLWLSADVDASPFLDGFGVNVDEKYIISGFGSHEIEYQHNKNKTKTVTYTFENIG